MQTVLIYNVSIPLCKLTMSTSILHLTKWFSNMRTSNLYNIYELWERLYSSAFQYFHHHFQNECSAAEKNTRYNLNYTSNCYWDLKYKQKSVNCVHVLQRQRTMTNVYNTVFANNSAKNKYHLWITTTTVWQTISAQVTNSWHVKMNWDVTHANDKEAA